MEIVIDYRPHPGQQQVHDCRARFRTITAGRRWGKTLCLTAELIDRAGQTPGDYAWIGPTYQITERGIDALRTIAPPQLVTLHGTAPRWAEMPHLGSRIYYLSSDNPTSIRGHGFMGLVADEAPYIEQDAWQYAIRPTISQTLGWAVLVGTPRGRNWFYDMHTLGGTDPDHASFVFPSNSSPYFPASEWDEARRTLPADVFRQEYQAEFLEDSAGVFRGIEAVLVAQSCRHAGPWVVGCDLAKHEDYTVLIAMCAVCGHAVAFDRFNKIDWPIQKGRIMGFAARYRGKLLVDSTGVGDPIYDDLLHAGCRVEGVKLTEDTKRKIIQQLIVDIEQRTLRIPAGWNVVVDELRRYEYEYTAGGHLRYNAPSGYHDDCVIALALANWGRKRAAAPVMIID